MKDRPVVLVVEDDEEMNLLQQDLLAAYGLDAVGAYTGAEALDLCERHDPDAILLDLMLPAMDGLEACKRLREGPRRIPIVIVTALDSDDCRSQGMEAGADAYFCKPFDPQEVVDELLRLLRASSDGPGRE